MQFQQYISRKAETTEAQKLNRIVDKTTKNCRGTSRRNSFTARSPQLPLRTLDTFVFCLVSC